MSLLIAAFAFGVLSGMPGTEVISLITEGFGKTIGNIGLIIILGILIGTFLENSGGAFRVAEEVLRWIGKKKIHTASALIGYVISIPVFADSGFLILSPLNQALSRKAGLSLAGTVAALALGLTAAHTMVPPTPGPIAAAGLIGADLGVVFLLGLFTSLFSLFMCILYARYIGKKYWISPGSAAPAEDTAPEIQVRPSLFKSLVPLGLPILLILLKAIATYPSHPLGEGSLASILGFLGNPVVALFIGVVFSLWLPEKLNREMLGTDGWVGSALRNAAIVILITGSGGALGYVLQQSGLGVLLSEVIEGSGLGIWVPFLMAAALKTAQGSSTVAIITTASIMAPLLPSMGLEATLDKGMVVIAIGAGSAVVSHANDSFFWVVTQLSGFSVKQGYRIHTLGTAVLGISAILFLSILRIFFN